MSTSSSGGGCAVCNRWCSSDLGRHHNDSAFLLLITVLQPRMMYKQSVMENKQFNRKTIALTACSVCQVQICFPAACAAARAGWLSRG